MKPTAATSRFDRHAWWILGLVTLLPLLWYQREFRDLFWFGDDWDQLDLIDRHGFWTWAWKPFGENFVPLAKLLWGGYALASGGSYFAMICLLWVTHAVNVTLLVRLLRQQGWGTFEACLAGAIFGLSASNIESLGWAIQWPPLFSVTCFLAAAILFTREVREPASSGARLALVVAWLAASAFSFVRGIVSGASLAGASLIPGGEPLRWPRRLRLAALCLLPAAISAVVVMLYAGGNHQRFGSHALEAAGFGAWNYGGNPLHHYLSVDSFGWRTLGVLLALKIGVTAVAWRCGSRAVRQLVLVLVLFDLGNSVLLGIGRYHTGYNLALSSRYQYQSLVATAPILALAVGALRHSLARRWHLLGTNLVAAALVVAFAWQASRRWGVEARGWADHRGRNTRQLLFVNPNPPAEGAIPGIEFLKTQRAKELVERYGLD